MTLASILLYFAGTSFASELEAFPQIPINVPDQQIAELAWSQTWRSLLRAEPGALESKVVSTDFFLSEQGRNDIAEELRASISIFFSADIDNRQELVCRFPARYSWLRRVLVDPGFDDSFEHCADYWQWSGRGQTDSISLFYANGYFENPASFFGHVLIRLNERDASGGDELLSTAIDYGALIPPEDRGLKYIVKGVFGFYDAGFSDTEFYRHNHNYGNDQLRDLWEYRLPLSGEQVHFMTLHLWELMSARQTYFFMSENCGTAINDLLQLVGLGIAPLERFEPWFLPSEIFIDQKNLGGDEGFPAETRFKPSLLTTFHIEFDELPRNEKKLFSKIVRNKSLDPYISQIESDKAAYIDLLLSYYEIRIAKEYRVEESKAMQQKLLLARLMLPPADSPSANYFDPEPYSEPHNASPPSMFRVSGFARGSNQYGVAIRYRPVQFDSLGLKNARPEHAHLAVLDTEVEFTGSKLRLRNLDILRIRSLNGTSTYLPADWPISWEIRVRVGEKIYNCEPSCMNASIEGGVGKTVTLQDGLVAYAFFNGGYQTSSLEFENIFVKPTIGILYDTYTHLKLGVEYSREITEGRDRSLTRFDLRRQLHRQYDLRLSYQRDEIESFEVGISHYF